MSTVQQRLDYLRSIGQARGQGQQQAGQEQTLGAGQQAYGHPTQWLPAAEKQLPQVTPLTQRPGYGLASRSSLPLNQRAEYGAASQWQLPQKPTIDPNKYAQQWDLSTQAINKQFQQPGGVIESMLNPVLERGLGSSGDYERATGQVADQYAQALAQARSGLDIARMQEQQGLDQWFAGLEAQRAQDISGRGMQLLGMGQQQEQSDAARAMQMLGLGQQQDVLGMNRGAQAAQLAGAWSGAQNETLGRQFDQAMQREQMDLMADWQRQQSQQEDWQKQLEWAQQLMQSTEGLGRNEYGSIGNYLNSGLGFTNQLTGPGVSNQSTVTMPTDLIWDPKTGTLKPKNPNIIFK
jgi:hypothetical protein